MTASNPNLDIFGKGERGEHYRLIACEVAYRECCLAAAVSPHIIDLQFLTQGLHDLESASMARRLQDEIDAIDTDRYRAILLGFGLCNNGIVGLRAPSIPLVVPRAHDCITLFLGSSQDYQKYFDANKGTYFLTTGWFERDKKNIESTIERDDNMLRRMGLDKTYEEYVEIYGEEQARVIMDAMGGGLDHYTRIGHIEMNIAPEAEERVGEAARKGAAGRDWTYEKVKGRMDLFLELVGGRWDASRFLVVPPGQTIQPSHNDSIIQAK